MTQRSVLTTQSKLTVQAPGFGERGASYAGKYSFRDRGFGDTLHWRLSCQMSHPWLTGGGARPCAPPRIWGWSLERKFARLLT
ncbi:MAG: hypothetical protein P4L69_12210 [Desulfosporosinus sp.]|nr:hypothetical protein [Desulfosporosinus sp.]